MATEPEPGTFLALLAEPERSALTDLARHIRFPRGTRLMHEGEPGDRVMILLEGRVKASSTTPEGQEVVLSFRGPGDLLGELSFIGSEPRSSSVTAIEPVSTLVLSSESFRSYLERMPRAALVLVDVIGRRFRDANLKRIQFGASDTTGRLAARLLELAERYGEEDGGKVRIALPITQEELAAWTASSRTGVAKALQSLRDLGWIETERRMITIIDVGALGERAA